MAGIGRTERGARYVQGRRTWSSITKRLAVTGTSECGKSQGQKVRQIQKVVNQIAPA